MKWNQYVALALLVVALLAAQGVQAQSATLTFAATDELLATEGEVALGPVTLSLWESRPVDPSSTPETSAVTASLAFTERWYRLGAGFRVQSENPGGADGFPFILLGIRSNLEPLAVDGSVHYGRGGFAYTARVAFTWPGTDGQASLVAAYRHWPDEAWYSGPMFGVTATF